MMLGLQLNWVMALMGPSTEVGIGPEDNDI